MKYIIALAVALTVCSTARADEPLLSYVVTYPGGTVTVETDGRVDTVAIKRSGGTETETSTCGNYTGNYEQLVGFARAFQAMLAYPESLATMADYPIRVNLSPRKVLKLTTAKALVSHYQQIFTPEVLARLKQSNAHEIFCHEGSAMIAAGTVWSGVNRDGEVKFSVINQ